MTVALDVKPDAAPDAGGLGSVLDGIPAPEAPKPDQRPKRNRPTTRAGRAAAAAAKGGGTPKQPRKDATSAQVAASVVGLHELAGAVVTITGRPTTGAMLATSAKDAGEAWAELSKRYPAVARLFTGSADALVFVKLLMVYAPIITTALAEKRDPSAGVDLAMLLGTIGGGTAQPEPSPAAPAAA